MKYLLSLFLLLPLAACDGKKDDLDVFAPMCERSVKMFSEGPEDPEDLETVRLVLGNTLNSCSAACDLKHDKSCAHLKSTLELLCTSVDSPCTSFCEGDKGSLKTQSCEILKALSAG